MSSQYSPDLRLELIGTGDQAGVWGSTTNTNLGTLLENAIAGYTSVAVLVTPQALTAYDGAADEARFAALALTTSLTEAFTVCLPPCSKMYVFYNASSYTATIANATAKNGTTLSGGSTVAIPAGKTVQVWSDGTNVSQQSDYFISPQLAGTPVAPTASYGTSTTQVATTAFVQAALQLLYPIGSIYSSTASTNPGTLFGFGTWVAYGEGRVLVGNGGGFTAGATGGSADAIVVSHSHTASSSSSFTGTPLAGHTHTATDSGHTHSISQIRWSNTNGFINNSGSGVGTTNQFTPSTNTGYADISVSSDSAGTPAGSVSTSTTVATAGSSGVGANLQPYVVVYMWNRTA